MKARAIKDLHYSCKSLNAPRLVKFWENFKLQCKSLIELISLQAELAEKEHLFEELSKKEEQIIKGACEVLTFLY